MPELPEVEGFKHHLDKTCHGRRISHVTVADTRLVAGMPASRLVAKLDGGRIGASRRYGKHLLIDLGKPGWLAMHFGMNGSLRHFGKVAEDPSYDRIRFDFADGHHLAYVNPRRIGKVELVEDPDAFIAREGLGPDALDPGLDLAAFKKRFEGRRGPIKAVLMDQSVVAGIGNIYSDEILFQAGIHPRSSADRLDQRALAGLFRTMQHTLRMAVECGAGSEQLLERPPRSFLLPQRKKGGRCPRCGGAIAELKFSGRTAYYCPRCQPPAG